MKTVAVLLDGGHTRHRMHKLFKRSPTASEIVRFANACLVPSEEELFRIYYYDCPPPDGIKVHPGTKQKVDFDARAKGSKDLHDKLRLSDHVAFRRGQLMFNGWGVNEFSTRALLAKGAEIKPADLQPIWKQKRVDMMIGLDIAWLSSKRIVDRLILVTGDTDFVPAMKFARREGVQVVIVEIGYLRHELREHADVVRKVPVTPDPKPPSSQSVPVVTKQAAKRDAK